MWWRQWRTLAEVCELAQALEHRMKLKEGR